MMNRPAEKKKSVLALNVIRRYLDTLGIEVVSNRAKVKCWNQVALNLEGFTPEQCRRLGEMFVSVALAARADDDRLNGLTLFDALGGDYGDFCEWVSSRAADMVVEMSVEELARMASGSVADAVEIFRKERE